MDFRKQVLKNIYQHSTSLEYSEEELVLISLCHIVNTVVTSLVY